MAQQYKNITQLYEFNPKDEMMNAYTAAQQELDPTVKLKISDLFERFTGQLFENNGAEMVTDVKYKPQSGELQVTMKDTTVYNLNLKGNNNELGVVKGSVQNGWINITSDGEMKLNGWVPASPNQDGYMTHESVELIIELMQQIKILQARGRIISTDAELLSTDTPASILQNFEATGFVLNDQDTLRSSLNGNSWTWFATQEIWVFTQGGIDIATNSTLGTVQGTITPAIGDVQVNPDGTMHTYGMPGVGQLGVLGLVQGTVSYGGVSINSDGTMSLNGLQSILDATENINPVRIFTNENAAQQHSITNPRDVCLVRSEIPRGTLFIINADGSDNTFYNPSLGDAEFVLPDVSEVVVPNFENGVAGLITGVTSAVGSEGSITANTDGTGSVIGFEQVAVNTSAIANLNSAASGFSDSIEALSIRLGAVENAEPPMELIADINSTTLSSFIAGVNIVFNSLFNTGDRLFIQGWYGLQAPSNQINYFFNSEVYYSGVPIFDANIAIPGAIYTSDASLDNPLQGQPIEPRNCALRVVFWGGAQMALTIDDPENTFAPSVNDRANLRIWKL